jgi:hypothetical protein
MESHPVRKPAPTASFAFCDYFPESTPKTCTHEAIRIGAP